MIIESPPNEKITINEFLDRLKGQYKDEIKREFKNIEFLKNPIKYKRLGLNEYLEPSPNVRYNVFIPKNKSIELIKKQSSLEKSFNCKFEVKIFDDHISLIDISGTEENIQDLIEEMRIIVEDLPEDLKGDIMYLNVPLNRISALVGVNGQTIEAIRKISKATIKFLEKDKSQILAISGDNQQKQIALNMINRRINPGTGILLLTVTQNVLNYIKSHIQSEIFAMYGSKLNYEPDYTDRYEIFISNGDLQRAKSYIIDKIRKKFNKNEYTIRN